PDLRLSPKDSKRALPVHFLLECDLRTREKAHGDGRLANGGKSSRIRCCKSLGDQVVADLCRSRSDTVQAVVAHRKILLLRMPAPLCENQFRSEFLVPRRRRLGRDMTDGYAIAANGSTRLISFRRAVR